MFYNGLELWWSWAGALVVVLLQLVWLWLAWVYRDQRELVPIVDRTPVVERG